MDNETRERVCAIIASNLTLADNTLPLHSMHYETARSYLHKVALDLACMDRDGGGDFTEFMRKCGFAPNRY